MEAEKYSFLAFVCHVTIFPSLLIQAFYYVLTLVIVTSCDSTFVAHFQSLSTNMEMGMLGFSIHV